MGRGCGNTDPVHLSMIIHFLRTKTKLPVSGGSFAACEREESEITLSKSIKQQPVDNLSEPTAGEFGRIFGY